MTCYVYAHVKLVPPTLGTWSMAGLLGQPLEYNYMYFCSAGIRRDMLPKTADVLFVHSSVDEH